MKRRFVVLFWVCTVPGRPGSPHYPSAVTRNSLLTTRGLSPLLDRALRLMDSRSFPHGIDVQWVRRKCNAEADAAANNAGLRARKHERRILFYDD